MFHRKICIKFTFLVKLRVEIDSVSASPVILTCDTFKVAKMIDHDAILLDDRIKSWVVWPLLVTAICVGLGRSYVQQLIKSEPVMDEKEFNKIRHKQTAARGDRLRMFGARFINKKAFSARKAYLCDETVGLLHEKVSGPNMNPMSNPNMRWTC